MKSTILLFDLGGVLVDLGDPVTAIGLDISNAKFWTTWLASPLVQDFETGKLSSDQFVAQFGAQLGILDAADFDRRIRRWHLPMFDGAEQFLRSLTGKIDVALLSNTNAIHWGFVQSQTDVFATFSKLFLSFETGNAKPDVAAFQDVIDHFSCNPDDIVFLDDNAHNVVAARGVGLRAKQVRGLKEVRRAVDEFFV